MPMNVHHWIVIDRPVDAVFEFVSDASNHHLWYIQGMDGSTDIGSARR